MRSLGLAVVSVEEHSALGEAVAVAEFDYCENQEGMILAGARPPDLRLVASRSNFVQLTGLGACVPLRA